MAENRQVKIERIEKLMHGIMQTSGGFGSIPIVSPYWTLRKDLAKLRNNDDSDDNSLHFNEEDLAELEAKND